MMDMDMVVAVNVQADIFKGYFQIGEPIRCVRLVGNPL